MRGGPENLPRSLFGTGSVQREVIYENRSADSVSDTDGGTGYSSNYCGERQEEFAGS